MAIVTLQDVHKKYPLGKVAVSCTVPSEGCRMRVDNDTHRRRES
jgi:hypothetical protein